MTQMVGDQMHLAHKVAQADPGRMTPPAAVVEQHRMVNEHEAGMIRITDPEDGHREECGQIWMKRAGLQWVPT